ncbi:MAG TPA: diacylglycerol kinase family protein [Thermodesulfobacteriota bacterium]
MKPIGIIFNPFADINKKKTEEQLSSIRKILSGNGFVHITNTTDEIPVALKELYKQGIKILGISGGDGTIDHVLSSYINLFGNGNLPVIAPLKGGTMNMLSGDVGLRGNQLTSCHKLVQYVSNHLKIPTLERGLIKVVDKRFNQINYTFTWLDGFLYKFIKWYNQEGAGVGVALKLILKSGIMSLTNLNHDLFKEVESRIYLNGSKLPFESHMFMAVSTVKRLVFGFRTFTEEPKAGEKFSVLYLRLPFFKKALYHLPKVLYGGLNSDIPGNFLNSSGKIVKIEGNTGYVMDGEVYESKEPTDITLEVGPKVQIFSLKNEKS